MHITITARQLREALELANPDGPDDEDQLDTEVTITKRDAFVSDDGDPMPAGLYMHYTDCPEEGVTRLGGGNEDVCHKCSKPWLEHDFGVPEPYCP